MSQLSFGPRPLLLTQAGLAGVATTGAGAPDLLRNHTPPPVTGSSKARRATQPRVKIRSVLAQPGDDWDDQ